MARTVGVEEELLLVDPGTGRPTPVSRDAVRANQRAAEVDHELFLQQIETSTEPCRDAETLLTGIRAGRRAVGEAAAAAGARAVAVPVPVLPGDDQVVTPEDRYLGIRREYGELARQALVCAMHVHVEVGDEDEAVAVVDGIRPWLPVLLALSANSPFWQGRDTRHASWRSHVWGRWPTAGPREPFGDIATYRAVTERLTGWGASLDPGMLYFDVRLSPRYPTVEVRVADVCTDVEDALLVALLARALVETVASGAVETPGAAGVPEGPGEVAWRTDLLRAAGWRASRFGLAGDLVHPVHGGLVPARTAVEATLRLVRPALEEAGDLERVTGSFERLMAVGGGATRQRRVRETTGDLAGVVADLARRTEESWG